ncbi:MAG: 50S ribosomal protein L24 [Candidatus Gracilibacteria bacterium]|nr:50S ribosomal protein L24 [Candidatus Gracilibacteria bacterium]
MKIRTGDKVQVMSGKKADKNQVAEVVKVFIPQNKVLVKGINVATRHIKKQGTQPGQIVKMEKPISASAVMLVCPFTEKPTRVGYVTVEEKGVSKKFRFSKKAVAEKGGSAKDYIIK